MPSKQIGPTTPTGTGDKSGSMAAFLALFLDHEFYCDPKDEDLAGLLSNQEG